MIKYLLMFSSNLTKNKLLYISLKLNIFLSNIKDKSCSNTIPFIEVKDIVQYILKVAILD